MNQHTLSIMNRIPLFIEDYKEGKISLKGLLLRMEGSIKALEEKLPPNFSGQWDETLSHLDVIVALNIETSRKDEILIELYNIEQLIKTFTNCGV